MSVACAGSHTLTLDDNKDVWFFGSTTEGQYEGDNVIFPPVKIPELKQIMQIAAGDYFSACVDVHGQLWTFGANVVGQLGLGHTSVVKTPTCVPGISSATFVSCGSEHTICISSKKVYTFGSHVYGQLGLGKTEETNYHTSQEVPLEEEISFVACGGRHSALISIKGNVWVFGANENGQLGLGDKKQRWIPVRNKFLENIHSVGCSFSHTIAMTHNRKLFGFGDNIFGELCNEDHQERLVPEEIKFEKEILSFAVSYYSTMILDTNRRVSFFGYNARYFDDKLLNSHFCGCKLKVPDVCLISTGAYTHVLLKTMNNQVWGFGNSSHRKLGFVDADTGFSDLVILPPHRLTEIPGLSTIIGTPQYIKSRQKSAMSAH